VARYEAIRAASEAEMHVHQMDHNYMQGEYMKQSELFVIRKGEKDKIYELRKPLYSLKQAERITIN